MAVSDGDINTEASAKYLNCELEKISVLADCQCLSFLNWLPPQFAPVQLKDRKSLLVATIQIFVHPFSSFPPLNAIKKIAHTPAARIRSTIKVGIFKHLLSVSARLYGQPIYRPTPSW